MQNTAFIVNPFTHEGYYLNGLKEGWHKFNRQNVSEVDPYYTDPNRIKDDLEMAYPTRMLLIRDIGWFESFSRGVIDVVYCTRSELGVLGSVLDSFHYATVHYGDKELLVKNNVLIVFYQGHLYYTANVSVNDIILHIDESGIIEIVDELHDGTFRNWPFISAGFANAKINYELSSPFVKSNTDKTRTTVTHDKMLQQRLSTIHLDKALQTSWLQRSGMLSDEDEQNIERVFNLYKEKVEDQATSLFCRLAKNSCVNTNDRFRYVPEDIDTTSPGTDEPLSTTPTQNNEDHGTVVSRLKEPRPTCILNKEHIEFDTDGEDNLEWGNFLDNDIDEEEEPQEERIILRRSNTLNIMTKVALFGGAFNAFSLSNVGGYNIPQYFDNSTRPYTGLSGKAPTHRGGKGKGKSTSNKGKVKGKGKRKRK